MTNIKFFSHLFVPVLFVYFQDFSGSDDDIYAEI